MNILKRIEEAEKKLTPKSGKIWVTIYGDNGRVQYGSKELIGMTREEVTEYTGDGTIILVVREEENEVTQ